MSKSFPKIFAIGTTYIKDIFKHDVEVTEKLDGSQFGFGLIDGELICRSKGQILNLENPEKLFTEGVSYIKSIKDKLPENIMFYGEYFKKPKHNTLAYDRIPRYHIMLFGAMNYPSEEFVVDYHKYADLLNLETVPVIYRGNISSPDMLKEMLNRTSVLGGAKIEGVVVKNYRQTVMIGGQPIPIMAGKFVSEAFKEVHRGRWGKEETKGSKWENFVSSFRTEARWQKAIIHLEEKGELENSPKDIGKLIPEIQNDITEEEKEYIKEFLWNEHRRELLGSAVKGFPEWYKERLLNSNF